MKALQLVVALAFLVIVHEFGHYIVARIFKIRVEKFYLFFNPYFSLLQYDPVKGTLRLGTWTKNVGTKENPKEEDRQLALFHVGKNLTGSEHISAWRRTIYGIGWLPLGGYCKIAGMIDESMDKEQMAKPAEPWEFRSKPAWQRLLVMIAGVAFNFILAIIIYAAIAFTWGNKYIPLDKASEGMDFSPVAQQYGFRNGDIPLLADGKPIDSKDEDFLFQTASAKTVTVLRNGSDTVNISLPADFMARLGKEGFMVYRQPIVVAKVQGNSPAEEAGLQVDDRIIALGDIPTRAYSELVPALARYAEKPVALTVERGGKKVSLNVTPNSAGKLGFQLKPLTDVYPTVTEHYGFFRSIPKGIQNGTDMLTNYAVSLKQVFTKQGAASIGGFGAIGDMFPSHWDWLMFWNITAFLSVALAFMNILPIPALDGGHVIFLIYEMIMRKPAPEKVLEGAQWVGMIFLLLLLVYANGADLVRAIF